MRCTAFVGCPRKQPVLERRSLLLGMTTRAYATVQSERRVVMTVGHLAVGPDQALGQERGSGPQTEGPPDRSEGLLRAQMMVGAERFERSTS